MRTEKQKLIDLLNQISFSSKHKKQEWLELVDFMDEKELHKVYKHFLKRKDKERKLKLKIIVKYGLENKYLNGIKKISKKFLTKAKNKDK